jgi:hypothetical protein
MSQNAVTKGAFFMGKTPYLFRRKNVFYFRVRIPAKLQNSFDAREIIQSQQLKTLKQRLSTR